jgi:transmembrane 9 superfamily protein 2/4
VSKPLSTRAEKALLPFPPEGIQELSTDRLSTAGWSVRSYKNGDSLALSTNKITSPTTQLPFAYAELPFVCPAKQDGFGSKFGSRTIGLNLGEVLRGDRITVSDYELIMGQDEQCKYLGDREVNKRSVDWAARLVKEGYIVEWCVEPSHCARV